MPGTIANGQFDSTIDNPTGKVVNAKTGYTLGSVQGHHLISTDAAQNSDFLQKLEGRGAYKHGSDDNKMWLPAEAKDAEKLGVARHSGDHLNKYRALVLKALEEIEKAHAKNIEGGMSVADADAAAAARIKGFQNWLRAGLTAQWDPNDPGKHIAPKLVLNNADPHLAITGGTADSRYIGLYDPASFSLASIEDNEWYKKGWKNGQSNFNEDVFKLVRDGGNSFEAVERGLKRSLIELKGAGDLAKVAEIEKLLKALSTTDNFANNVDGKVGKVEAVALLVLAGSILKIAHDSGLTIEQALSLAKSKLPDIFSIDGVQTLLQVTVEEAAKYYTAYLVAGKIGLVAMAVIDSYDAVRGATKGLALAFPETTLFVAADKFFDQLEDGAGQILRDAIEGVLKVVGFAELIIVDGSQGAVTAIGGDGRELMIGHNEAVIIGGGGNDWMFHTGSGSADGGAGNDTLIGLGPDYTPAANGQPEKILELRGGDGSDWVMSFGGPAKLYGGSGSDRVIGIGQNTFLWGGDGVTTDNEADIFTVAGGSFIQDAGKEDFVTWVAPFFRVTGGVQLAWQEGGFAYWQPFGALTAGLGPLAAVGGGILGVVGLLVDVVTATTFRFALSETGQLVIQFAGGRGGQAVIENYKLDLETGESSGNVTVFRQEFAGQGSIEKLTQYLNLALKSGFGQCTIGTDPLILDLDGDGIELTGSATAYFDLNADGFQEKSFWTRGGDGFLVRDLNANGRIDNINEMFGNATTSGFTHLRALDSNNDGRVNASDAGFKSLRVWVDADGDAVTDAGELRTLASLNITSIGVNGVAPATGSIRGNTVRAETTFTRADGTTGTIADVLLQSNPADTIWTGDRTISTAAAALPELKGFGRITDLRVQMSDDATLLTRVDAFAKMAASSTWTQLKDAADDVLFRWAGVDGVAATAIAGSALDMRELAFLEKYFGTQLMARDAGGAIIARNIAEVLSTWNEVLDAVTLRLAVQGPLKATFAGISYAVADDSLRAANPTALATAFNTALKTLPASASAAESLWMNSLAPLFSELTASLIRSDGNVVRADFVVAALVRGLDGVSQPLQLQQLVNGLGLTGVQIGTDGADSLTRAEGALSVMVAGRGDDALNGGGGQTVYVFGRNFGQDVIEDSDNGQQGDRIRFAFLDSTQVTLRRSGDDLIISVNGSTDRITIKGQFESLNKGIEEIQFADGKIFETGDIMDAAGRGTSASETIEGSKLADQIEGLQGNDILKGGDTGDLYYFSRGHGQDQIFEEQTTPFGKGADILLIENGYTQDDVILSRAADSNDLVLTFRGTTDRITIVGQFAHTPLGVKGGEDVGGTIGGLIGSNPLIGNGSNLALDSRIEGIFFKAGGGWSWGDVQTKLIAQSTTEGADVAYGFGTADTFYASKGNDRLIGGNGGDTYHFSRGSGQDVIEDSMTFITIQGTDRVVFGPGITRADLVFTRPQDSNDLVISIRNTRTR